MSNPNALQHAEEYNEKLIDQLTQYHLNSLDQLVAIKDQENRTAGQIATNAQRPEIANMLDLKDPTIREQLRSKIKKNLTEYAQNEYKPDLLIKAIHEEDHNVIKLLIDQGVDLNSAQSTGFTPLRYSAMQIADSPPSPELLNRILALLLDGKADPNLQDSEGTTPLIFLIRHGTSKQIMEPVQLLMNHGANPLIRDENGKSALEYVKDRGPEFNTIKELIQKNLSPTARILSLEEIFQELHTHLSSFDLKDALRAAGYQNLKFDAPEFIVLANKYLPANPAKARSYIKKIISSDKLSWDQIIPLIMHAQKQDSSWVPLPEVSQSQLSSIAMAHIRDTFPTETGAAAIDVNRALEKTTEMTPGGSDNRLRDRMRKGNHSLCPPKNSLRYNGPEIDAKFIKGKSNLNWIHYAAFAYISKSGNCGYKSYLTLYYLIKDSFSMQTKTVIKNGEPIQKQIIKSVDNTIQRIEAVEFTDIYHVFLIINRAEGSDLTDPRTWGKDALIADPWLWDYPEIRLFPAAKAMEGLTKMRKKVQFEAFAMMSITLTTDLLNWWQAGENEPLPTPNRFSTINDDNPLALPLSLIQEDEAYVQDYIMQDEDGDRILLLPDITKYYVKE